MRAWYRCFGPRPHAAARLVCFPHAGGSAAFYRDWGTDLPPELELQAAQYPGRADRMDEPVLEDAHELARLAAEAMTPLLDRPVALFGHSMGAVVAYEVARLLQASGSAPAHLFASAAPAPHEENRGEPILHEDDDRLVANLARLGGSDVAVLENPELRDIVLPYVRGDLRLIESYRHPPGEPLSCPVTAFAGDADPVIAIAATKRWAELTRAGFTHRVLTGDHFYLDDHRSEILSEIAAALRRTRTA